MLPWRLGVGVSNGVNPVALKFVQLLRPTTWLKSEAAASSGESIWLAAVGLAMNCGAGGMIRLALGRARFRPLGVDVGETADGADRMEEVVLSASSSDSSSESIP